MTRDLWDWQQDPPGFNEAIDEFRAVMTARPRQPPPMNDEERAAIERQAASIFSAIFRRKRAEANEANTSPED